MHYSSHTLTQYWVSSIIFFGFLLFRASWIYLLLLGDANLQCALPAVEAELVMAEPALVLAHTFGVGPGQTVALSTMSLCN